MKVRQANIEKEIQSQTRYIRSENGYKLWSTPSGEFWTPDTSHGILPILLAQQQRKIYGDAESGGVRAGDIVLDGGAHVGTYIRTALDAGAAKVVAIEPSPEAIECLRRNFAKEVARHSRHLSERHLGRREATYFLFQRNGAAGDSFVERGTNAKIIADIPVTTIDRIVHELGLPRVDLIKADIKGAGTRMITWRIGETIRKFHPRIVVSVEEAPEDPASIKAAVLLSPPTTDSDVGHACSQATRFRTIRFSSNSSYIANVSLRRCWIFIPSTRDQFHSSVSFVSLRRESLIHRTAIASRN